MVAQLLQFKVMVLIVPQLFQLEMQLVGTVITIQGNGFDSATVVSIGNAACKVISVSINQLTCKTSANAAAANLNFQIR